MKGWLAAIAASVLGLLAAFLGGNARGKAKAKQKAAEHTIKMVRKANEVDEDLTHLSDDDIDERLRKWTRDK